MAMLFETEAKWVLNMALDNTSGELGNGTIGGLDNGGYDTPQAVIGLP